MSETTEQNETTRQQVPHERVVMPPVVTDGMQIAAVKKAVELGLLPKWAGEEDYLRHYSNIKDIVQAALDAA